MKKITILLLILFYGVFSAQSNFELTTLRIGPYKIFMKTDEAEKISGKKFQIFEDYTKYNYVKYEGEIIGITIMEQYESDDKPNVKKIFSLTTKSTKFRTKSGIGVGSTKNELTEAYKNYPNYSMNQVWDNNKEAYSKTDSRFSLTDNDAGTVLTFVIQDNIITSVEIWMNEGGC